jgi:hypothetical protein
MGFLDDLASRAQQEFQNVQGDIQDYLKSRVVDAVVKVGDPAKGNLNAAQIASGQFGGVSAAPVAAAPAAALQNASQASQISAGMMRYMPLIIAGVGAYFIFSGKKGK